MLKPPKSGQISQIILSHTDLTDLTDYLSHTDLTDFSGFAAIPIEDIRRQNL